MMHFTVESYTPAEASCHKCCCEVITLQPGTTTKVSVGYAPWAIPIGQLHCTPQFAIELLDTCPVPIGDNLPPAASSEVKFSTAMNSLLESDLKLMIADPEAKPLTFKLLPLYGPKHGKLNLLSDGTFSYMPVTSYTGEERFYVSASDGAYIKNFEVMIAIGIDAAIMAPMPHISIGPATINQRFFTVSFPVTMSPAADECEIWRLTVMQAALDCDCTCYTRTDCFDIKMAKC